MKDWWCLAGTIPCSQSDADHLARRKQFNAVDSNGNGACLAPGYCSLRPFPTPLAPSHAGYVSLTEVERLLMKLIGKAEAGALARPYTSAPDLAREAGARSQSFFTWKSRVRTTRPKRVYSPQPEIRRRTILSTARSITCSWPH